MQEITSSWLRNTRWTWMGCIVLVLLAVVTLSRRSQRHDRLCAEATELMKDFQVISDPFTRPKLFRHKAAKNLNPTAKLPEDEVLCLATSDGDVVFVHTYALGSIQANPNGYLSKTFASSGTTVSFGMNDTRIKLLAKDLIFEPRLDPCYAKASTPDRYSWIATWVHQDKDVIETLGKVVISDNDTKPYLYRLTRGNVEGTIDGPQLVAFKQTFRLAELIRETGK